MNRTHTTNRLSLMFVFLAMVPLMGARECQVADRDDAGTPDGGEPDGGEPDGGEPDADQVPTGGETNCIDRVDDDGDGAIDCEDTDCERDPACWEGEDEICNDRVDNDGDGLIDCGDEDCVDDPSCDPEGEDEICDDRIDNDLDGATDCEDEDCADFEGCPACGDVEICDNAVDDDCDGFADCDDPECTREPACYEDPCPDGDCERYPAAEVDEAFQVCGMVAGCMGWDYLQASCVSEMLMDFTAEEFEERWYGLPLTAGFMMDGLWAFMLLEDPGVRECFVAAETCDDVYACTNLGEPSEVCGPDDVTYCDGDVLRDCMYSSSDRYLLGTDEQRAFAFDCASIGESCLEIHILEPEPPGTPGTPGCAVDICDMTTFTPSCEDGAPVNCFHPTFPVDPPFATEGFISTHTPCPEGSTCQVGEFYGVLQALCVPEGAECDEETFVPRCDEAGRTVSCDVGHEYAYECPEGMACQDSGSGPSCFPVGDWECEWVDIASSCDETSGVIDACIDYYERAIDCVELGFETCVQSSTASGYAYCQ